MTPERFNDLLENRLSLTREVRYTITVSFDAHDAADARARLAVIKRDVALTCGAADVTLSVDVPLESPPTS